MLFDFFPNISNEDAEKIVSNYPVLQKLWLEINCELKDVRIRKYLYQLEFEECLRQFNNRIGEIIITYVFLIYYYQKGILDGKPYISLGRKGQSIEFFPDFDEKYHDIKFFFDYFIDVFYYQIYGVWDSIWHLLNTYYHLNIEPGLGFGEKVCNLLKDKNFQLYSFLKELKKDEIYQKSKSFRNDITHNFKPHEAGLAIRHNKDDQLKESISVGIGQYITSKQFMEDVDMQLYLLSMSLEIVKKEIEHTEPVE